MGAWGGIIMSFFGAVFADMTLALCFSWTGPALGVPFLAFTVIAADAVIALRRPGPRSTRSLRAKRVIMASTIGEGLGLFVAANLVINLGHPELLLPVTALVVGLHFLPMAYAIPFRPFYPLALALLAAAALGFVLSHTVGATIAGLTATAALWVAAVLAVRREKQGLLFQ